MHTAPPCRSAARAPLVVLVAVLALGGPTSASGTEAPPTGNGTSTGATVTGTVERVVVDRFDGTDVEITAVVPDGGEALVVRPHDVEGVASGSLLEVTVGAVTAANQDVVGPDAGARVSALEVLRDGPARAAGSPAGPATAGTTDSTGTSAGTAALARGARTAHVLTALLPGQSPDQLDADGVTPDTLAADLVDAVSPYWSDSTGGAVTFAPGGRTAAGVHTGWGSSATCTNTQVLDFLAWTAQRAGVHPAANTERHTVTYTPRLDACPFAGVAHVASGGSAWVNGSDGVPGSRADVISHELGHTLELGHSDSRTRCTTGADGSGAQCTRGHYGDAYDVMGIKLGNAGPLNAAHLDTLGLLGPSSTAADVTGPVTLSAVGALAGTRFVTFTTGGATYYVEHRGAVGRDADLATSRRGVPYGPGGGVARYAPGVVVHRVDEQAPGAPSHLLRMTTADPAGFVLPVGGTFRTADGAREVRVTEAGPTSARVEVVVHEPTDTRTSGPVTTAASGLVRTATNGTVYLVAGSVKHPITNLDLMVALGPLGPVRYLPQSTLDALATGPVMRRVVAAPDGTVSFVDAGIRLPLGSCAQVADFGYSCGQAIPLEAAQIAQLHPGPPMTSHYRTTSGKAFHVTAGTRREVADTAALTAAGLPTASVTLLESGIAYLPLDTPVTRDGQVLRSRTTATTLLADGGVRTPLTHGLDRVPGIASLPTAWLDEASLALLPRTAPLAPVLRDADTGAAYLLTAAGRVHLTDPAVLPATVPTAPARLLARIPAAGTAGRPVFVRSADASTVYLLLGGQRRPIGSWADLVAVGGSASPVIRVLPGTAATLLAPGPLQVAPGTLVKSADNGTVYLTDGAGSRLTVGSFTTTTELGATRLVVLPAADLAGYALRPGRITTAVACGTDRYLGLSGRLHPVTPAVADAYRLTAFTTLDPTTCAALRRSTQPLDRFLRTPEGTIYHVADGTKRPIDSWSAYLGLGGTAANTLAVTPASAALVPTA